MDLEPRISTVYCLSYSSEQPCVSVGNVAQLAVDLFINSLQLSRVGHLHHASVLPLVGSSAFSHTSHCLHTAAEGDLLEYVWPDSGSPSVDV